ncbi:hypothetical protein AMELA_G00251320 [Ameiurus melas]|uniref:Uncharacterized protein n=1 Tax=Ameiurus melas TaxID=219545 RepID=A0A7J5ZQJ8_AMEME|nr:hypothetical protein AMELA_G00251320 [Ameiurus melas]
MLRESGVVDARARSVSGVRARVLYIINRFIDCFSAEAAARVCEQEHGGIRVCVVIKDCVANLSSSLRVARLRN